MNTDTCLRRLLIVAAAAGSAACTTYVGHKLGPDGTLPPAATGIPYVMTVPEYTLDVTADSEDPSKEVYTLHKTDVPDPNQRYTIALDPALFNDGKFTVKLGDNGNLTEANSVVASRVVATIKAVGAIAAARAKGALDFSSPEGEALDRYRAFLKASTQSSCTASAGGGNKVASKIDGDIKALVDKGEAEKPESGIDVATSRYFYASLAEKDCLAAVRITVEKTTPDYVTKSLGRYDAAVTQVDWLDSAPPTATNVEARTIVKAVKGWVQAKDAASIDKAVAYTGKHYRDVQGLDNFVTAARAHVNQLLAADRVKALARAFDIKPEVWRARAVKSIGRDIEALRLEKDLNPANRAHIAGLIDAGEQRRAELVGGTALFERIRKIDDFLKEVRTVTTANGGVRYAAEEHIKLREERDKLSAQLQGLIASTVSSDTKGAVKADVKPRKNQSVRLANQHFVDQVNAGLGVLFDNPPEFVLVLTRKDGGNFSDPPILKSATEGRK